MRKKIVTKESRVDQALADWKDLTEYQAEMAQDIYNAQDSLTKEVLERIRDRLRSAATGFITIKLPDGGVEAVKIEKEYIDMALLFLATEVLKDLAVYNIQVAGFQFPENICTGCGGEIKPKVKKKVKR